MAEGWLYLRLTEMKHFLFGTCHWKPHQWPWPQNCYQTLTMRRRAKR